jgi:hypothetical protein
MAVCRRMRPGSIWSTATCRAFNRGRGRVGGQAVLGSSAPEFYLAPALQYVASSRFMIEASYQFPVIQNVSSHSLRTESGRACG